MEIRQKIRSKKINRSREINGWIGLNKKRVNEWMDWNELKKE
jgi:hypothetical protein